jgi:ubiquinone/menaquinone biosynthesis C-methylase UbiE
MDLVLLVTTICFVDNIHATFKEAFRVVTQNGSVIVAFVDKSSELGRTYSEKKAHSTFYKDATFYDTGDILEILAETRFTEAGVLQTLIPNEPPGTIEQGYGKGSFVVIKAMKMTPKLSDCFDVRCGGPCR